MEEKSLSKMAEKEILRQQLELLAERSKEAKDTELHELTMAMSDVIYSIDRISEDKQSVEKTGYSNVKDALAKQHDIWFELNESIQTQGKWNKLQLICLVGTFINSALFLIYLLEHF